jgi:hypothetical protein
VLSKDHNAVIQPWCRDVEYSFSGEGVPLETLQRMRTHSFEQGIPASKLRKYDESYAAPVEPNKFQILKIDQLGLGQLMLSPTRDFVLCRAEFLYLMKRPHRSLLKDEFEKLDTQLNKCRECCEAHRRDVSDVPNAHQANAWKRRFQWIHNSCRVKTDKIAKLKASTNRSPKKKTMLCAHECAQEKRPSERVSAFSFFNRMLSQAALTFLTLQLLSWLIHGASIGTL